MRFVIRAVMSRNFIASLPILLLLLANSWAAQSSAENEPLSDGSIKSIVLKSLPANEAFTQRISLAPTSNVTFNITDIPSYVSFIIVQVHTYQYNVTLSYNKDGLNKVSNTSIFGSNIGLFIDTSVKKITQIFLKHDNIHIVDAMLVVTAYDDKVPIPGGCNMEFDTEVAPYEKSYVRDSVVIVDLQPASVSRHDGLPLRCEQSSVQHEMYRMYLPAQDYSLDTYFSALSKMFTVKDIVENGLKVPPALASPSMRRVFSAYPGIGSVYVAVATKGNYSSATNIIAFAAEEAEKVGQLSLLSEGSYAIVLCVAAFFLGFLSVFLGNIHLKTDMILPVFVTATVIAYIIAVGIDDGTPQSNANTKIAITGGFTAALIWTLLNSGPGMFCTDLIFSLTPGLFFASVMYFYYPGMFAILDSNLVFWILFATVSFSVSLSIGVLSILTAPLTCALFGSYMMILPIDYYAGSCLKYIVINVIRRATVPDFATAVIQPPHQTTDTCLIIFWTCLTVIRVVKQICPDISILYRTWEPVRILFRKTPMHTVTERTPLITS